MASQKKTKIISKEISPQLTIVNTKNKTHKDYVNLFLENRDLSQITYKQASLMFVEENRQYFPLKSNQDVKNIFRFYCKNEGQFLIDVPKNTQPNNYQPIEIIPYEAKTIDLTKINPANFIPLSTDTAFDIIASKRNGIMKGTVYILSGESGAGKTTIATNIGDYIQEVDPTKTCAFISGEMDENDWIEECIDNPRLASLPTIFLLNYLDAANYMDILMQALTSYHYVVLDSFEVVLDQLKNRFGWTGKKAETELIELLRKAATKGTAIMCIQQFTKGGSFVGSNKIKHLLTGMLLVMFDKNGDRYVKFTKNRRGGHMVDKRLYFTKHKETGRLEFNKVRFENDQALLQHSQNENDEIFKEQGLLDEDFLQRANELAKLRLQQERERKIAAGLIPNSTISELSTI